MDLSAFSAGGSVNGKRFAHGMLKRLPSFLPHGIVPCLKGGLLCSRGIRAWHPGHGGKVEAQKPAQAGRHMTDALITERAAQACNERTMMVRRKCSQRCDLLIRQRFTKQMLPERCKIEVTE